MTHIDYEPRLERPRSWRLPIAPMLTLIPTFAGVGSIGLAWLYSLKTTNALGGSVALFCAVLATGIGGVMSLLILFFTVPHRKATWSPWWFAAIVIAVTAVLVPVCSFFYSTGRNSGYPGP